MSSYLPEEIILNILSRLQVKTLLRFRCVCKSWCNLITSHDFVQMHLNHALDHEKNKRDNCNLVFNLYHDFYSIDSVSSSELCYESIEFNPLFKSRLSDVCKILASCNGLLCIGNVFVDNIFIWNPSTKEYKEISLPTTSKESRHLKALGFGYDCKIDDYKLVTIFNFEVNVYTLGSNSWRNVPPVPLDPFDPEQTSGVVLNGALDWINYCNVLLSFDIGHERFQKIKLPNCLFGMGTSNVGVLRGDLCLFHTTNDDSCDVGVMKDYGVVESWTKLFSIAQDPSVSHYLKLMHCFKNGEILFWVQLNKENYDTDEPDYYNDDTDDSDYDNDDKDESFDFEEIHGIISYDPKHEELEC